MKAAKDCLASELRRRVKDTRAPADGAEALVELERRRSNLRGAVIPAWERALRGENFEQWALV